MKYSNIKIAFDIDIDQLEPNRAAVTVTNVCFSPFDASPLAVLCGTMEFLQWLTDRMDPEECDLPENVEKLVRHIGHFSRYMETEGLINKVKSDK